MRKMLILALLMIILIANAWAQPTPPSTPPSPESMGLQAPQPTASTTAVPPSESGQMVYATEAAAQAAAPSPQATAVSGAYASTYMVVPPGTSAFNKFYIPYSPSTVASCYYGQWVPMWLDVRGYGPLYTYEWYPNGRLVSKYMANIPYPSWRKMWFYGDAPGWHTLQYYCNGWSNYIYVYVYGGTTPPPQPPASSCNAKITVSSPYSKGYSVYVDGYYKGGDGQYGDPLDGYYTFYVPGNQQHTIKVNYQGGTYQQTKTYYCGSTYTITLSAPPSSGSPPSTPTPPSEPVYPTLPIYSPGVPTQPIYYPEVPTQPIYGPEPGVPTQPIANQPTVTPY
jgi:hypothetical protein